MLTLGEISNYHFNSVWIVVPWLVDETNFISLNHGWSGKSYFIFTFKPKNKISWKIIQTQPGSFVDMNYSTLSSLRAMWKAEDKDKLYTLKFASLS